ncbi:MAG: ATP-binding cassette domain-containing protein [Clostridiales bacterium]|nr:ATP-binding cassette domain-containing protein [Clostridiales bacterium]
MDICVENICKHYGKQEVLKNVNAHFASGQIHGLIGRNGSGKTVLFRCIIGYTKPDTGEVRIGTKRVGIDMRYPDSLGLILDTPGFLPQFTGQFNLELLMSIRGRPEKSHIQKVMCRVGLPDTGRKPVGKYSMGMRQRLGIAQAIMEDPHLLILDEPFNGLDSQGVADIHSLLKLLRSQGKTILITSHYVQDIEALCDTVHEMQAGILQQI